MPLRDHFRPPVTRVTSWQSIHAMWPSLITMRLNELLPPGYGSGLKTQLGRLPEVDVLGVEYDNFPPGEPSADAALAWRADPPTLTLDTAELVSPEYEVQVYDRENGMRLVAAVEIISPGNKDRASAREAFVSKCRNLLAQDVCVVMIDTVTERSHNLYADLAEGLNFEPPAIAGAQLYAVGCRARPGTGRHRFEAWEHVLAIGSPLPTLPLWYTESDYVPLELERTYEATCRGLKLR